MNILFLIDTLTEGGAEELLVNTVNELVKLHGFNVHVATTKQERGELLERLSPKVNYKYFDCKRYSFLKGVFCIRKYIKKQHITIVHAHLEDSIIISRFAVPSKVKLIVTYHNMTYSPGTVYHSPWRVFIDKITHHEDHISIYVSNSIARIVEGVRASASGKYHVLPNFSEKSITPGYRQKPEGSLRLVSIANLKKVKNIEFAIEALKDLKELPITWDIIGEGDSRSQLEEKIHQGGNKVNLLGRHSITNELLSSYDAFVIMSFHEGMPLALLEAMAFGLPSLLPSHLVVMNEVAGESALYFSITEKEEFQKILTDLLQKKDTLRKMSEVAIQRSKMFSKKNHIDRLLEIYKN